jgi:hypothetical protein
MRSIIGRIAGVIAGAILTFLADTVGIPVAPGAEAVLTEGITLIGLVIFGLGYATTHKAVNHYVAPLDSAAAEPIANGLPPRAGR